MRRSGFSIYIFLFTRPPILQLLSKYLQMDFKIPARADGNGGLAYRKCESKVTLGMHSTKFLH